MPLLRILALACAVVVMGSAATAQSVTRAAGVRLHHLHFRTGDIAAAMGNTVRTYGGTRTVVQGLGAGVRVVDTYLLFELQDDAPPDPPGRPVPSAANAFIDAARWLGARGVDATVSEGARRFCWGFRRI